MEITMSDKGTNDFEHGVGEVVTRMPPVISKLSIPKSDAPLISVSKPSPIAMIFAVLATLAPARLPPVSRLARDLKISPESTRPISFLIMCRNYSAGIKPALKEPAGDSAQPNRASRCCCVNTSAARPVRTPPRPSSSNACVQ